MSLNNNSKMTKVSTALINSRTGQLTCSIALRCVSEGGSMCSPLTLTNTDAPPGMPPRVCLRAFSWVATM